MNQVSRLLTRKVIMSNRECREEGFSLLEMIVAVTVLALVIAFISTDLVASARGTQRSQSRLIAQQIASKTLQQVESLGYETASEGVLCTTSACTALQYQDPLGQIQYNNTGTPSTSCFYYVPTGTTLNPTTDPVVPGQYSSNQSDAPIVPNVSSSGSTNFPQPVVDGTSYTVVVYPMFNQASSTYSGVNCANLLNDTAPNVPLSVIVEVSWGKSNSNHVSMQTALYDGPQTSYSAGNCPTPAAEAGSHNEQLMANQETEVNASGAWTASSALANPSPWQVNYKPDASGNPTASVSNDPWVSVMFLDEQATPYTPSVCISDGNGNTADVPLTALTGYSTSSLGTSSSNVYYSGSITPVHQQWSTGSSPNAGKAPTGGTYCTSSTCSLELVFSFEVPSSYGGLTVKSLTVADWDHEGDLDFATWDVQP